MSNFCISKIVTTSSIKVDKLQYILATDRPILTKIATVMKTRPFIAYMSASKTDIIKRMADGSPDFGCKGSHYRFCQSLSQSDICRFRHMTLLPLHLVVNWQVFTINNYKR